MNDHLMHASERVDRDEAMNFVEILFIVWQNKWLLIVTTAICVGLSLIYVFTARDWYRADVLLKLADTKSVQGLSGQLGGLGGLVGLAGIDLGENKSAEPVAILKSREFIGSFIEDQNLIPVFFAHEWDVSGNRWKTSDITRHPDIRDAVRYFNGRILKVVEDKKTGLITLTIEWTDAKTAATWANLLVERVNDRMRQRALTEGETTMMYLKQELIATTVVTLQQSIGRVLEGELQKLALAKANKEFAFRILDHAQVPKWRSRPQPLLIVPAAFLLGVIASIGFLISRHVVRRYPRLPESPQPSVPQ
jgi:uncharacterized protein involved in exopolysaccharide biosynthesis